MGLESLLDRLEGQPVTPVTPAREANVTAKAAPDVPCTPVTPVTPSKTKAGTNSGNWTSIWQRVIGGKPKSTVWMVTAGGNTFPMIRPGGMTEPEALEAARARWPEALVSIPQDSSQTKAPITPEAQR